MRILLILFTLLSIPLSAKENENLWVRPIIIGASLGDGFHHTEFSNIFGGAKSKKLSLDLYLNKAIQAPHGKIYNFSSSKIFLSVDPTAKFQIQQAKKLKPTVIISPDFLFWYVYGKDRKDDERMTFFQKGLDHLASFDCPVIIGNIPDASRSIGRILGASEYPGKQVIKEANEKLRNWLKKHPNVYMIDLSNFLEKACTKKAIVVRDQTIPAGQSHTLLQRDLLHPTKQGATILTLLILDHLQKSTAFPETDVNWLLNVKDVHPVETN